MRSAAIASLLLAGLSAAQDLPMDAYDDVMDQSDLSATGAPLGAAAPSTTVTYDQTSVLAAATSGLSAAVTTEIVAARKRDTPTCTTRSFNGPQVTDPADTDSAFLAYPPFHQAAHNYALDANIPADYSLVPGFVDLQGSGQSISYLTYTAKISAYDPAQCAAKCNAIAGCVSFNIYFERDPLIVYGGAQVPNAQYCPATPTSPSATLIKCAFFSKPLTVADATNVGSYQEQFHLVIAGSNAYASIPSIPGYSGPTSFGNGAIQAPSPPANNGYLRVQTFGADVPYDPTLCSATCDSLTGYASRHGGSPCVFFNSVSFPDCARQRLPDRQLTRPPSSTCCTRTGRTRSSPALTTALGTMPAMRRTMVRPGRAARTPWVAATATTCSSSMGFEGKGWRAWGVFVLFPGATTRVHNVRGQRRADSTVGRQASNKENCNKKISTS